MSPVCSLVEAGQAFRFWSRDLELTMLVVGVEEVFDLDRVRTTVLVLDVIRDVPGFRASSGQLTDWHFNRLDGEWLNLSRLW